MSPPALFDDYSENTLVEQPAIALFAALRWQTANLYHETFGPHGTEGRESEHQVILPRRLKQALKKLNSTLPDEALTQAVDELTRDRSTLTPVAANRELYRLLKDGVKVSFPDTEGNPTAETVKVMDWNHPQANDFLLASQVWVAGDMYRRRCDLIGFVNGLPLLFAELKASHKNLKTAYDENLRDYRYAIPQLFTPNALILLSNGSHTKIGSLSAEWEHCFEWKRINDEGEQGVVSLETAIRGLCDQARFLDLVENFTLFEEARGGLIKKVAKNHQYLGVNKALAKVQLLGDPQFAPSRGRLGVFWHTQGSGKSLSMVFFTQKILRTLPGNWTFVIVTDRDDLDHQIYKTFTATGAVTGPEVQAKNGEHLKELLTQDHRYVFTLIQKFHAGKGETYPQLSDRRDIIVITDEAHRSQYDIFAMNMRNALPQAAFIGFTGTPLIAGEEQKTREVFGDYVSIYDFARSVEDGATVPLYYENRIPELQLTNENLNEDMERLLEAAELDEAQEQKLEKEFAREYHLITRDDRLEAIAQDLVWHFVNRGYRGKAMMVCIDKATAVRMYDKVQAHWNRYLADLKAELAQAKGDARESLLARIGFMESTDRAVVVSQAQNEVADLKEKGLDITPHRKRMVQEDLDEKFKDPDSNLRLVFVCAMWITGFDVPTCSTLYLDKPMKNHTLMQTIARVNRVAPGKTAGLIVDYVGIFRNLQRALAIYAKPTAGGKAFPIQDKTALIERLRQTLTEARQFCQARGIDLDAIRQAEGFARIAKLDEAVEAILRQEEDKKQFLLKANLAAKLYKAILPDPQAQAFAPEAVILAVIAQKIRALLPQADISQVMSDIEALLNDSIATEPYRITAQEQPSPLVDLSQIDFDALQQKFEQGRRHTEAEKLQSQINRTLIRMVTENRTRLNYLERFQAMIAAYNSGSKNIEEFFTELMDFAQGLQEEEKRGIAEGLSEEELAIFDLLTKPTPKLTKKEEEKVKAVAKELLETLKREKLVLDWREKQQARAAVRQTITRILRTLPGEVYPLDIRREKIDLTYCHIYDNYKGAGQSIYQ